MSIPNKEETEKLLKEIKERLAKTNIGIGWLTHSFYVAEIAKAIGLKLNIDENLAYLGGLFHDIGRCVPKEGIKSPALHEIEGYKILKEKGYDELARFCITHGAIDKEKTIKYYESEETDLPKEDKEMAIKFLKSIDYNIYDKIVQMSDNLAVKEGYVTIEQRVIDLIKRRGDAEYWVSYFDKLFELKKEIEKELGESIYKIIPDFLDKTIFFDYGGNI